MLTWRMLDSDGRSLWCTELLSFIDRLDTFLDLFNLIVIHIYNSCYSRFTEEMSL